MMIYDIKCESRGKKQNLPSVQELYLIVVYMPECDVPVHGIPSTRNFSSFFVSEKFGSSKKSPTAIGKIWYRKKESELVPEISGTRKSLGTGIGKSWYCKSFGTSIKNKTLIFVAKI